MAASVPVHAENALSSRGKSIARRLFSSTGKSLPPVDLIARADEARDRHDWAVAARDYAAAIDAGAASIALNVQLGHALKELGDYAAAEAAYRRFLESRPNDADINLQLGHLYNRQGDLTQASAWYEIALQLAPSDGDIAGHAARARQRLERADVETKRARAMALVDARAWHQARFLLNELVTIDGEDDMIGIFANVTKETGDFAEAQRLYGLYEAYARAKAPDLVADVELQLGHLHRVMRDETKALCHYIRARDCEAQRSGGFAESNPYDAIVHASIDNIYSCFWRPR